MDKDLTMLETFGDISILKLGEMIRYNTRAKIKNENVATHSWIACANVIKVCDYFKIDKKIKRRALEIMVVHDLGELATNDIPYDFKQKNPQLQKMLNEAELDYIKEKFPAYFRSYADYLLNDEAETIVGTIVRLADAICVLQYTNNEILLGNQCPEMKEINDESKKRITNLSNKLILKMGRQ